MNGRVTTLFSTTSHVSLIEEPLVIYDCDRPVNTCTAFTFTTADRAKDLRQKPV